MKITIANNNSNTELVGSTIKLRTAGGMQLAFQQSSGKLTFSKYHQSLTNTLLSALLYRFSGSRYITRINNVDPAADGVLFLSGSACDSVVPGVEAGPGVPAKLVIVDLCPSCTKCDTQYRLRRQIEFYKIYFDLIKDINLYDNAIAAARHMDLLNRRIPELPACIEAAVHEDDSEYTALLNTAGKLLQNYITTVHMWNYAVSINNNDVRISNPPEDTCGISVQAKRALTDCSGVRGLRCRIDLNPRNSGSVQENLSIFVPTPDGTFKPFSSNGPIASSNVVHIDSTHKAIIVEFYPMSVAGTCIVTAKFLPFIYVEMALSDGSGVGEMSGGDVSNIFSYYDSVAASGTSDGFFVFTSGSGTSGGEVPGTSGGEVPNTSGGEIPNTSGGAAKLSTGLTVTPYAKETPTAADYNNCKSYPSKSVSGQFNNWQISVVWEILHGSGATTAVEQTQSETFYFTTPCCRVPMSGVVNDSEFIEVSQQSESEDQ